MNIHDFFGGFFAELAVKGLKRIKYVPRDFDQRLDESLGCIDRDVLSFRVKRHTVTGESQTIKEGIASALAKELIELEKDKIIIKLTPKQGQDMLGGMFDERLPIRVAEDFYQKIEDELEKIDI